MNQKPLIVLGALICILLLIISFRAGQKVEKTNKLITYLVSIPPTKPLSTPAPVEFKEYLNNECKIKFLYPSSMQITPISSFSAKFSNIQKQSISFLCQNKLSKQASQSAELNMIQWKNKQIKASVQEKENQKTVNFSLIHPMSGKEINFSISQSLYSLLEKTFEFIQ